VSIEKLLSLTNPPPKADGDAKAWADQLELFEFLQQERSNSRVILYGSSFNRGSFFLRAVLIPVKDLEAIDPDTLAHWDGGTSDSWGCGLVTGGGEPPRVEFSTPHVVIGSTVLSAAQYLVHFRSFSGRTEDKSYYEIPQFLAQAHELHWTPERRAWCRFSDGGDVEDVVTWAEEKGKGGYGTATCIEIDREVLEMHMSATGTVLVQMFDSTRVPAEFHGWKKGDEREVKKNHGLYFRSHTEGPNGSWVRGIQVIRPRLNAQEYGAYLEEQRQRPKHYETFITQDWKNKRVTEVSCDPKAIASYFDQGSPLPFQTSPVFFNAAVLDKYRADPEKYSLEHRSVACRNSWHLQTYDVNAAGQVHTYIKYLGDLPHSEQLYWKAFNEPPQDAISKRAFKTDFEGSFDLDPDPLRDLQTELTRLQEAAPKWFTLREPELLRQLNYPLTASNKIWGDVLKTLAKLVVEGLERGFFESKAREAGAAGDAKWGSIRWAEEAMRVGGVDPDIIAEVLGPLRNAQFFRTKLDAHSGGVEASALRASLLRQHKTPRAHVEVLSGGLVQALKRLSGIFGD
jgi:hypothetical protein